MNLTEKKWLSILVLLVGGVVIAWAVSAVVTPSLKNLEKKGTDENPTPTTQNDDGSTTTEFIPGGGGIVMNETPYYDPKGNNGSGGVVNNLPPVNTACACPTGYKDYSGKKECAAVGKGKWRTDSIDYKIENGSLVLSAKAGVGFDEDYCKTLGVNPAFSNGKCSIPIPEGFVVKFSKIDDPNGVQGTEQDVDYYLTCKA